MTICTHGGLARGGVNYIKSNLQPKKNWLLYRCSISICTHDSLAGKGGLLGHKQIWSHTKGV